MAWVWLVTMEVEHQRTEAGSQASGLSPRADGAAAPEVGATRALSWAGGWGQVQSLRSELHLVPEPAHDLSTSG